MLAMRKRGMKDPTMKSTRARVLGCPRSPSSRQTRHTHDCRGSARGSRLQLHVHTGLRAGTRTTATVVSLPS
eukprot:3132099-Rhodomonas_salina.1